MDLGISGRRAVVCASSKGLGRACAEALPAEGGRAFVYRAFSGDLSGQNVHLDGGTYPALI